MTETPDQTPDQISDQTPGHTGDETAIALPDRLAADPKSPFHDPELLARGVGVRFKGVEKTNVEEYCVSEGWIRVPAGNARDRKGNPMTLKLKGSVEVWLREPGEA